MRTIQRQIFKIARLMLSAFLEQHTKELDGRKGVCLAVMTKGNGNGHQTATCVIGSLPEAKRQEKERFAKEKVARIQCLGEDTSFQSEDEKKQQYGGGIKVRDGLWVSASGFPPDLDEKFVLMLALMCDELNRQQYGIISELSSERRTHWKRLRKESNP
jgi:hypothetical protein